VRIIIKKTMNLPMKQSYLTFKFKYHENDIPRDKSIYLHFVTNCM
jgi:hypothetical protein